VLALYVFIVVVRRANSPSEREHVACLNRAVGECTVVILGGVSITDGGGGQRSAQLARWFEQRLCAVHHFHVFADRKSTRPRHAAFCDSLIHSTNAQSFLSSFDTHVTLLVEIPHVSILPWLVAAASIPRVRVVFELIDDWRHRQLGGDWYMPSVIVRACEMSATLTVTATALKKLLPVTCRERALLVPNAASEWDFYPTSHSRGSNIQPPEERVYSPAAYERTAIYVGALWGDWLSWDHLKAVALTCPCTRLLVIGSASKKTILAARSIKNIHFIGEVSHARLSKYMSLSDVTLIPFLPKDFYDTISPIKLFEYAFSGKIVVSTPSDTLQGVPGVLVANSSREFAAFACEKSLPVPSFNDTISFLALNSWSRRVQAIIESDQALPRLPYNITLIIISHNKPFTRSVERLVKQLNSSVTHRVEDFKMFVVHTGSHTQNGNIPNMRVPPNSDWRVDIHTKATGESSGRNLAMMKRRELHRKCTMTSSTCANPNSQDHLWIFLDVDHIALSSSWLEESSTLFQRHAKLGAIGSVAGWVPYGLGIGAVHGLRVLGENTASEREAIRTDIGFLRTRGLVIRGDATFNVGEWDEQCENDVYADIDYSFRLRKKGYMLGYRRLGGIIHLSHTRAHSPADTQIFHSSHTKFFAKWRRHRWLFHSL
jgi:GT2 family glycosyltransferase